MSYLIQDVKSSLISEIEYISENRQLRIAFRKYYVDELIYENVPFIYFEEILNARSKGQFYLQMIKPKFTIKTNAMADKPKTVNYELNKEKRFIKMSIEVTAMDKSLFTVHESGKVYAQITLQMSPDGKVDKYGNLGMVTQDVPTSVYKAEKNLPADKRSKGKILGNGAEFERRIPEGNPGDDSGTAMADIPQDEVDQIMNDLPF